MGELYEPPLSFLCRRCAVALLTRPKRTLVMARARLRCSVCGSSDGVVPLDELVFPGRVPTLSQAATLVKRGF